MGAFRVKAVSVAAAVLCLAVQTTAHTQAVNTQRASVANGETAYLRVGCHACHGTVGHGGAGTRLAPNTLPLAAFEAWIRSGTPGWSFARGMPAFSAAVLTDQEVADIRAFLASLPAPPAAQDIPLLNQ